MSPWNKGDRALCIKVAAGAWLTGQTPAKAMETFPKGIPVRGETYTVDHVNVWNGRTCLALVEKPTRGVEGIDEGWAEYLFTRTEPICELIEKEAEATL